MQKNRRRLPFWVLAFFAFADTPCHAEEPAQPFGLKTRVPWTTSRMVGSPDPPPPYTVERVFPKLTFKNPVYIAQEPGTNRLMVGELAGKIYAFDRNRADPESLELFLDIGRELYSFSFHPQYEENGYVFTFSPKDSKDKSENKKSRVSRYRAAGEPLRRCAAATEEIIFEWRSGGHNGGEAIIGPDGYLYISTGDGTSGSDPNSTGQGVDDFFSVILRIDVTHPEKGRAYSIPKDNPFVQYPGAMPEIWAHGFRNPWRMSFDAKTGGLWVGDVGQDLWEMIWLVERGGNYGWSVREGSHAFHPHKKQGPGPILPPVVEHHHTECRSITGGYVYYGEKFPELAGVYFYGDYEYGKIWGVRHDGEKVVWQKELANTALRIPTFGVSRDGVIYLMDHPSGELYQLVRAPAGSANQQFPRTLSDAGLFASVKEQQPAPGVIPYSVNAPQWTDHAEKQRWIALPGESKIKFTANTWTFDDGTVLAETLSFETEPGSPASRRRIETRILVKQENHWLGYSYLWNEDQTDAALVQASGREVVLSLADPNLPGEKRQQTWRVPSRNECMVCHSRAAGFVLGLRTVQVNKAHNYQGVVDNQLRAFEHAGIFTAPLGKSPSAFAALANPYDDAANLAARARAYLHVNCSVCHVSDGGGNARITLRHDETLKATRLLSERPMHGSFGLSDAQIVTPGDPFSSVLFYRLSKIGRGRMPHIGSKTTDQQGLNLIYRWISQLKKPAENPLAEPPNSPTDYDLAVKTLRDLEASPELHKQAIAAHLSSTRGAFLLATLVGRRALLPQTRSMAVRLGVAHADVNIRDLFERFVPESERTQRLGALIDPKQLLAMQGDAEAGRRFFFSATASQCKSCHRVSDKGGNLGPDLSHIGKKYKPHELLESLLEPAKKIDPQFATASLATVDGRVLTGIVLKKDKQQIVLNTLSEGQVKTVRIPVEDVEEFVVQQKSLMPEQMLRDFTAQQAADLLAYLISLK